MSSSSSSSPSRSSSSSSSESRYSHKNKKQHHKPKADAGHFEYKIGMKIKDGQFTITKFLGDGTFGRVLEVRNEGQFYAMKCIKAVERYIESAKIETRILWQIQDRDKEGKGQIVRLLTTFHRYNNYFMIFERLGKSLYQICRNNNHIGYPISYIQQIAEQIFISIGFLHSMQLTHTDIKPENILCTDCQSKPIIYNGQRIFLPENPKIKVIDLGGATFDNEYHSTLINTRQYRAPEVILGYPKWNQSSDVWSIACVLIELYTGQLYFQNKNDDIEHLKMIEKSCGNIPEQMYSHSPTLKDQFDKLPDQDGSHLKWRNQAQLNKAKERVRQMQTFNDIIPIKHVLFTDLIKKLMKIVPTERLTCVQALSHPFFKQQFED